MNDEHDPHPGPGEGGPELGSVAEEAAKLIDALQDWTREQGHGLGDGISGLAGAAAHAAQQVDEHLATGAAECRYCPVCRTVHVLRSTSPEVRHHLASAAASLMHAAAGLLSTDVPQQDRHQRRGEGVEHIDLDEDWPGDETHPGTDPGTGPGTDPGTGPSA